LFQLILETPTLSLDHLAKRSCVDNFNTENLSPSSNIVVVRDEDYRVFLSSSNGGYPVAATMDFEKSAI
jgi:hypothetical protein